MATQIDTETLARVQAFHGHLCPGLTTGIRVSEVALREVGPHAEDEEIVAVVETNNCAIDAIQFLTGCTFGKGNLIYLDHGKNVYTFARRSDGKAVRIMARPRNRHADPKETKVVARVRDGSASAQDRQQYAEIWKRNALAVLDMDEDDLFEIQIVDHYDLPAEAEIHPSVRCDGCGAMTMASRITVVDGRNLCPTCQQAQNPKTALMQPIGVVHNDLRAGEAPPRAKSPRSVIEIHPRYAEGLKAIEAVECLDVLFWFDRASAESAPMLQHPRGDRTRPARGVFTLRSPRRPNPIGVTTVRLLEVKDTTLVVEGLDAWDGTAVLDIKPSMCTFRR